ncbi:sensor histidine kinase [Nonomuraea deserti]|uniref:histidine kinase n=1 Tax=Nonomuraea deserti TaxID=1848322 RepID=A0A4R4V1X5_9ACTN|nr:histidine kinase [Nonomuraea deserti]TDC95644.1 sensor histidine kinase [Nonomuraea deserti]
MTAHQEDGAPAHEYRWALPSVLLGDARDGRRVRRSTRDWIVDTLMFLLACGLTLLSMTEIQDEPAPLRAIEQIMGALSCAAVWLRRRWPVGLAVVTTLLSSYLELPGGASIVALFTVAVHRPFRISGPVALFSLVTLAPYVWLRPQSELDRNWTAALGVAIVLTVFAWGIVVRARRQVIWSLRQQAEGAAEEARRSERERIAREMHDVLAHRISMLSLHAGALEFRPDAPTEEIARAAGAIRNNAHLALQDLREVIGVLRAARPGEEDEEAEPVPERPQPTLADLPHLAEECRQAGMDVRLTLGVEDAPEGVGRNLYRIVQEALTNARKHAGGAPVAVTVAGKRGKGVSVEVRNPLRVRHGLRIPGAGAGLIGLTERAELAGGRLEHGATPEGEFLVRAWLPWPVKTTREDA